jgi:hypothetical protein
VVVSSPPALIEFDLSQVKATRVPKGGDRSKSPNVATFHALTCFELLVPHRLSLIHSRKQSFQAILNVIFQPQVVQLNSGILRLIKGLEHLIDRIS